MYPTSAMIRPRTNESTSLVGAIAPIVPRLVTKMVSPYWHIAWSVSPYGFATIDDLVNPIKRKYAHTRLLNFCEVGSGFLEPLDERAISFATVAVANGAADNILTLTDVHSLLRM